MLVVNDNVFSLAHDGTEYAPTDGVFDVPQELGLWLVHTAGFHEVAPNLPEPAEEKPAADTPQVEPTGDDKPAKAKK